MESAVPVDAAPATAWDESRPDGLSPRLWADARPTEETLDGLSLPDGTVIHDAGGQLLGWESENTDRDLAELWLTCAQQFPSTGLWPICNAGELRPTRCWDFLAEDGRPYWLDPYVVPIDVYDVVNVGDRADYFQDADDEPGIH